MNNVITLKLRRNEIPVTLEIEENSFQEYVLKEMSAHQRDKYLDSLQKRMAPSADGKSMVVSNFTGMQADLISLCLHDASGVLVSSKIIQEWPSAAVTELFKASQTVNGLETGRDAATEPEKNG